MWRLFGCGGETWWSSATTQPSSPQIPELRCLDSWWLMLPVLVVFSVVLVIDGGFEDPLLRHHGPQSCGEYIVATTVHSWYLSQPTQPAVVYFFQASSLFRTENAKFWPILAVFLLLQIWCTFTELNNAEVSQNLQIWGMPQCTYHYIHQLDKFWFWQICFRFTSTRCLESGSYAYQGLAKKMAESMVVRCY